MLRAVFFDLDHTLQDLDTPFHAAVAAVFEPICRGVGLAMPDFEGCLHTVWPDLWRRLLAGDLAEAALYTGWFAAAVG